MSYIRVNAAFGDLGYYTYFCGDGNRACRRVVTRQDYMTASRQRDELHCRNVFKKTERLDQTMTYGLVSLSIIMMIAVACPIITQLIPGKPMPQTVLLLVFGAIFGPFILDKIWVTKAVELLSELGLAFLFQLDVVLGAFAAGFILRFVTPNGNHTLNLKLEGVGYGFLIPVFFVVSGASIDVKAVVANPALLITFIIMLLLVHAVPIFVATTLDHRVNPLDPQDKLTVSLYCTTALPLIVAVTSLAVQGGTMHQTTASTLVAAGAVTVFLMPLLGGLTSKLMKGETRLIAPTA